MCDFWLFFDWTVSFKRLISFFPSSENNANNNPCVTPWLKSCVVVAKRKKFQPLNYSSRQTISLLILSLRHTHTHYICRLKWFPFYFFLSTTERNVKICLKNKSNNFRMNCNGCFRLCTLCVLHHIFFTTCAVSEVSFPRIREAKTGGLTVDLLST